MTKRGNNLDPVEVVTHVLKSLNHLNIPYMLVGSLSLNLYAVPRHTNDADFVVQPGPISPATIATALGDEFTLDRQMGFETITSTLQHRIEHIPTGFVIELFELTADAHDQARFSRRRTVTLAGVQASVPTPEDVIIQKLRWAMRGHRTKDIADAENIIHIQKEHLDLTYIRQWADQHGSRKLFERLLAQT